MGTYTGLFPLGFSVKDSIDSEVCSLKYLTADNTAKLISSLGRGTLMAKLDIAHAYRNIPFHPDDQHLLSRIWNSQLFINTVLPFGLRPARKYFRQCQCYATLHPYRANYGEYMGG